MRMLIELVPYENGKISLPIGYNNILQGFFYSLFSSKMANFLHSKGFLYEKRGLKLFTFSKITGVKFSIVDKIIHFVPPIRVYFSSAVENVAIDVVETLIKKEVLKLGNNRVMINNLKILPLPEFDVGGIYKTLSPISVYSTKEKRRYFTPNDTEFRILIQENIRKKYEILVEKKLKDFEFSIEAIGKFKHAVIRYKGGIKEGVEGKFFIKCPPEIMQRVYDAGIGANTSSGFGMIRIEDV